VSEKRVFKSFADFPADAKVEIEAVHTQKHWVKWDTTAFRVNSLELAMRPLAFWLDARFEELVREKVHREDIKVQMKGSRCTITVKDVPRFEFKIKTTMEKCDGG
jgi:hypothetical protein